MDGLTQATQFYISSFGGYLNQFTIWGKSLFFGLLLINIVWLCIRYAFDDNSIAQSVSNFIKQFFAATFFYTLMVHPEWLNSLLDSAQVMGHQLTHAPIDPSSLVYQGIALGNQVIAPANNMGLLTGGFGLLLLFVVYVIIQFVFISIALELALTLIMTTAMISLSAFLLAFAGHGKTQSIAQNLLDVILSNCVKLLGIYCVVGVGTKTISTISTHIPRTANVLDAGGFDPYVWIVAATLLLWLLAKNLPNQLAKVVSTLAQDLQGTSAAAMAMSTLQAAKVAGSTLKNFMQSSQKSFEKDRVGSDYSNYLSKSNSLDGGQNTSSGNQSSSAQTGISKQFKDLSQKSAQKSKTPEGTST